MKDLVLINPVGFTTRNNPLGLQIVEAVTKQNGYDVEVLDLSCWMRREKIKYDINIWTWIESKILENPSIIYGISIMNATFPWAIKIAEIIKKLFPQAIVFVGGSHATALKEKIFEETEAIDYVLPYEGEHTVPNFVSYILDNKEKIPSNVIGRNGMSGKIYMTCEDINLLPKLNYSNYTDLSVLDIEVGRGCAYNCYYCSAAALNGRRVRYKSIDKILEEAEEAYLLLNPQKQHLVNFGHDNFLSFKEVFKDFATQKIEKGYIFRYGCEGRIDLIDNKLIKLLAISDCCYLFVVLETGSKRMQEICRKRLDLTTVEDKIKKITDLGIPMEANFIIGFPEETLEDLYDTINFATKIAQISNRFKVSFSYISPEPCTEIFDNTNIEDYILMKDSPACQHLLHCGFDVSKLSALHFNNLYTRKSQFYDIIKYIRSAQVYFPFLRRFYVTTYLIIKNGYKACDVFESARNFTDEYQMALHYKEMLSLSEIESEIIEFELDIYLKKRNPSYTIDKIYKYSIQQIYKDFLKDKSSYMSWEHAEKKTTHVFNK